jgi:hypothetical protein
MTFGIEAEKHVAEDLRPVRFNLQRSTVEPSEVREELQGAYYFQLQWICQSFNCALLTVFVSLRASVSAFVLPAKAGFQAPVCVDPSAMLTG